MRTAFFGLALITLVDLPAHATEPYIISLPKDGPWVADYDVDSCRLAARFGKGDEAIVALFTRYVPGNWFDLSLTGDRLKRGEAQVQIKVGFGPGQSMRDVLATSGTRGGKPALLLGSNRLDGWTAPETRTDTEPPPISVEQEAAVSQFTVQLNRARAYRLELGSMNRPMAEMRKCMDTLLTHWGYDPAVVATLTRPPTPTENPGTWASSTDYPSRALSKGLNGIVQFRLDVDEAGQVAGCRILARTDPDEFSVQTCKILSRRAHFLPALDAAGKPVKSFYVNKVRFMMGY